MLNTNLICAMATINSVLPTAEVAIQTKNWYNCRMLIDSGSESSIISDYLIRRLNLKRKTANLFIKGISDGESLSKGTIDIISNPKKDIKYIRLTALITSNNPR